MNRTVVLPALALAVVLGAGTAEASLKLIAKGSLDAATDLSGLTDTLENGLSADVLGGIGSGLAHVSGTTFLALPDRGPNATPYNGAVDDTVSYISRFQTMTLQLVDNPSGVLPKKLVPTLTGTTLLWSSDPLVYGTGDALGNRKDGTPLGSGAPAENTAGKYFFTGRSDNFGSGSSGAITDARLDPEGIRLSKDGKSVFISDEYGPYIYQFDRATGRRIASFELPTTFYVDKKNPVGSAEISGNTSGRTANKGMEGLAITPDGKTLVGIMQAALIQDAKASPNLLRIVTVDIETHAVKQYAYLLTTGSGVSEILAINGHELLVDERDGKGLGDGSSAKVKQIFKIDLANAVEITGMDPTTAAKKAVKKTLVLDLVSALGDAALGADRLTPAQIPAKIEGLAFGDDIVLGNQVTHTLYVANDNDFTPAVSGPSQWFVFGFTDADLPNLALVPEPSGLAALGTGLLGLLALRRRRL